MLSISNEGVDVKLRIQMEESKEIFQEGKLLSGKMKLKGDEYLPKECFITKLRIETKRVLRELIFLNFLEKKYSPYLHLFVILYLIIISTIKHSEWRGIRVVKQLMSKTKEQKKRRKGADVVDKIHLRDLPKIWNLSTCIATQC